MNTNAYDEMPESYLFDTGSSLKSYNFMKILNRDSNSESEERFENKYSLLENFKDIESWGSDNDNISIIQNKYWKDYEEEFNNQDSKHSDFLELKIEDDLRNSNFPNTSTFFEEHNKFANKNARKRDKKF